MPGSPVGPLVAKCKTSHSITLKWKKPKTDGGCPITEYRIEVRPENSHEVYASTTSYHNLEYEFKNLKTGYKFMISIYALNENGESATALKSSQPVLVGKSERYLFLIYTIQYISFGT